MFIGVLLPEAVNTSSCYFCLPVNMLLNNEESDRPVDVLLFCCSMYTTCVIKYLAKPFKSLMALDSSCQVSHKLVGIWVGYDCASTATYNVKHWTLNIIIIIIMRNTPIIGADSTVCYSLRLFKSSASLSTLNLIWSWLNVLHNMLPLHVTFNLVILCANWTNPFKAFITRIGICAPCVPEP